MDSSERVLKALNHEEPDRVPITDFFWSQFYKNWLEYKDLPDDTDIYDYYDLDLVVINPNMDPKIMEPEIIKNDDREVVFNSGWGSKVKMQYTERGAMPGYLDFSIKEPADYADFEFEDPTDDRRYEAPRQDLINTADNPSVLFDPLPSYMDFAENYKEDFSLFGGVCEANEVLVRARGLKNHMEDIIKDKEKLKSFVVRATDFMIEVGKQQLERVEELDGLVIWGDMAYDKGMFYSPDHWREIYRPQLKRMCDVFKSYGAKLIYHGCGNAKLVYEDLIEVGIDAYNPLEVKAGLDVEELEREYGDRLAFFGGIDVRVLSDALKEGVKEEVLKKLNAARGGGYIVASDHSVAGNVPPENYEYMVELVKQYGKYPLDILND
ncbi:MAG: uroporphyrinogen decarboxylase family protein [Candidatus Bipolaricaulota bacterium]